MNRTIIYCISITLLAISLISCAPMHSKYFQPTSDGKHSPKGCGGGPNKKITIQLSDGVAVKAYSEITDKEKLQVIIEFEIRKNNSIKLASNEFKLITKNANKILFSQNLKIKSIVNPQPTPGSRRIIQAQTEELIGNSYTRKFLWIEIQHHRTYYIFLDKYDLQENIIEFSLNIPSITINGRPTKIPMLDFKKESGIHLYAFNC